MIKCFHGRLGVECALADKNGQSTLFFGVDAHDRSATCSVLLLEPGDLGKLRIAVRTLARPLTLLRFAAHKIMLPQQPLDDRDTDRDTWPSARRSAISWCVRLVHLTLARIGEPAV